jgi:hypothetical protein
MNRYPALSNFNDCAKQASIAGNVCMYADDLVHLAPSLPAQQYQADLVCGFCAYTGLEISVSKVEAISINHIDGRYHTPYLTLHRWDWTTLLVQHWDDGYWIHTHQMADGPNTVTKS